MDPLLRPLVPLLDVEIRAADRRRLDLDDDLAGRGRRIRHLGDLEARAPSSLRSACIADIHSRTRSGSDGALRESTVPGIGEPPDVSRLRRRSFRDERRKDDHAVRWTPFRELDLMERRMRRMFEDVGVAPSGDAGRRHLRDAGGARRGAGGSGLRGEGPRRSRSPTTRSSSGARSRRSRRRRRRPSFSTSGSRGPSSAGSSCRWTPTPGSWPRPSRRACSRSTRPRSAGPSRGRSRSSTWRTPSPPYALGPTGPVGPVGTPRTQPRER